MQVMSEVTNPLAREHTMTKVQGKGEVIEIKAVSGRGRRFSALGGEGGVRGGAGS